MTSFSLVITVAFESLGGFYDSFLSLLLIFYSTSLPSVCYVYIVCIYLFFVTNLYLLKGLEFFIYLYISIPPVNILDVPHKRGKTIIKTCKENLLMGRCTRTTPNVNLTDVNQWKINLFRLFFVPIKNIYLGIKFLVILIIDRRTKRWVVRS